MSLSNHTFERGRDEGREEEEGQEWDARACRPSVRRDEIPQIPKQKSVSPRSLSSTERGGGKRRIFRVTKVVVVHPG